MKKVYLGIDAHKEQNVIALAFAGRGDPELYGKAPADLDAFVRVLRRVLEKYGLAKEDVAICYEAGPTGLGERRGPSSWSRSGRCPSSSACASAMPCASGCQRSSRRFRRRSGGGTGSCTPKRWATARTCCAICRATSTAWRWPMRRSSPTTRRPSPSATGTRRPAKPAGCPLPVMEFIRRFLQHVLPSGFVKVRHYGLHHPSRRAALSLARAALCLRLGIPLPVVPPPPESKPCLCPRCAAPMVLAERIPRSRVAASIPAAQARAPPTAS